MDVSVIIVNWNTKLALESCIESIYKEAGDVEYEIIVIDNASSDGSAEMVRCRFPEAVLIVEQTNRGYAAAVNKGIGIARGRYVLVLNSDTVLDDAAIEKTVKYADQHPKAAVIGCQVRESLDRIQMTSFRFPSLLNLFLRVSGLAKTFKNNRFFGREHMLWWKRDSQRRVDVVSGMFMFVRADAIREVGLMDEDYFMYCEETDWCYRFSRAGWKVVFWPGARITHFHGGSQSTRQNSLSMFVQLHKSLLLFLKKHKGPVTYFAGRVMLAVSFAVYWGAWIAIKSLKSRAEKDIVRISEKIQQSRAAFKFCAFGSEP